MLVGLNGCEGLLVLRRHVQGLEISDEKIMKNQPKWPFSSKMFPPAAGRSRQRFALPDTSPWLPKSGRVVNTSIHTPFTAHEAKPLITFTIYPRLLADAGRGVCLSESVSAHGRVCFARWSVCKRAGRV